MIDLMCLRQSYERRKITEIKWIKGGTNLADAMTKSKPCPVLKLLVDTNKLDLQVAEQVERDQQCGQDTGIICSLFQSLPSV